ncbi:JmjC domain-containing protein, partial [Actinophytocola sp.]|uniref:JmjC domain-containing protein n=1 Tax=Actinophytocola sp. TaxID=1872138 RepID=UPI003D6B8390
MTVDMRASALDEDRAALLRAHAILAGHERADLPTRFAVRPRELLSVAEVERVLAVGLLRYPYLALVRDGVPVPIKEFTTGRRVAATDLAFYVDGPAVAAGFAAGATVVLNAMEDWHPPADALAGELTAATGGRVQVTAFLTPPGARGLAVHRDDVHVYAIQLAGAKAWTLHAPPAGEAWAPGPLAEPPADPVEHVTLAAGECLFLRRGRPHAATAQDGVSLHISFTIRYPKVADVVRDVLLGRVADGGYLAADPDVAAAQLRAAFAAVGLTGVDAAAVAAG